MTACFERVVGSEDLPLHISRENPQRNNMVRVIVKNIVKKCMEMFAEVSKKSHVTVGSLPR